jgi:hypothetical protein
MSNEPLILLYCVYEITNKHLFHLKINDFYVFSRFERDKEE